MSSYPDPQPVRAAWLQRLVALASPPLAALAEGRLLASLSLPPPTPGGHQPRRDFASLETTARTLLGLSPWLELPSPPASERADQARLRPLAVAALEAGLDPASPDAFNFNRGAQPLVDAAFLAQACLHAPQQLFNALSPTARTRLLEGWRATRAIPPYESNWLLFASLVEAALHHFAQDLQPDRVHHAVARHAAWYLGDGTYGDGPELHCDYYNSFVIHPLLLETLDRLSPAFPPPPAPLALPLSSAEAWRRARRYAEIQERSIAPDGSFPPVGRSLAYRCGAFHHLAFLAFRRQLPPSLPPAAVRSALDAVIRRTLDAPHTFDSAGFLHIGLAGHQPALAEPYICVASTYLCTAAFLPLGLPADDPFWSSLSAPWTAARLWSGEDLPADKALPSQ